MSRHRITFVLLLLMSASVGCQSSDKTAVHGKITIGSEPVVAGMITFMPSDGAGPSAEAIIEQGAYRLEMQPGSKQVRITALKTVGQQHAFPGDPQSPMVPIQVPIPLGERAQSLSAEIGDVGDQEVDFAL